MYHLQAPTILFTKPSCRTTQLLKCCHDNSKSTEPSEKGEKDNGGGIHPQGACLKTLTGAGRGGVDRHGVGGDGWRAAGGGQEKQRKAPPEGNSYTV